MEPQAFKQSSFVDEAAKMFGATVTGIEYRVGEKYVVQPGVNCLVCSSQDARRPWKGYTVRKKAFGRLVAVDGDMLIIQIEHKWLICVGRENAMTEDEDFVRMKKGQTQETES